MQSKQKFGRLLSLLILKYQTISRHRSLVFSHVWWNAQTKIWEKNRNLSIKKLCPRALLLRIIGGAEQTLGWISFMDTDTYRVHFSVWQQSLKNLGEVVGSRVWRQIWRKQPWSFCIYIWERERIDWNKIDNENTCITHRFLMFCFVFCLLRIDVER